MPSMYLTASFYFTVLSYLLSKTGYQSVCEDALRHALTSLSDRQEGACSESYVTCHMLKVKGADHHRKRSISQ